MKEASIAPFGRWPSLWRRAAPESGRYPEIDVFEKDNRLVTRIDLPGMKKEDVKVEVTRRPAGDVRRAEDPGIERRQERGMKEGA